MTSNQRTCKSCGAVLEAGRPSRAYCNDACKQAAYYRRRKADSSGFVTATPYDSGLLTVTKAHDQQAATVTKTTATRSDYRNNAGHFSGVTITKAPLVTDKTPQYRPQTLINNPLNDYFMQPDNQQTGHEAGIPGDRTITVMGMSINREWISGLLGSVPYEQQRDLSLLMLETIIEVFPDMGGLLADADENEDDPQTVTNGTGAPIMEDAPEDEHEERNVYDEAERSNNEDLYETAQQEEARVSSTAADGGRYRDTRSRNKGTDYLDRFSSPLIRRGMQVWEDLSIKVPGFMTAYVSRYVRETGMQVQAGNGSADGTSLLHILFHHTDHRRQISRLLDLVLEAGEGLLRKQDFEPGGEFSVDDMEDQADIGYDPGEIDYDCDEEGAASLPASSAGRQFVSPQDITGGAMLHLLGIGGLKRA